MDLGQAVQESPSGRGGGWDQGSDRRKEDAQKRLVDFLFERVRHYVKTVHGLRDDVINAVLTVTDRQTFELRRPHGEDEGA